MGTIVFLTPSRRFLTPAAVDCAYMVGSDGIPWATKVATIDDRLIVTRATHESGRFVIPWSLPDGRCVALSTATLLASDEPYHLALELSRGTLDYVQGQLALWESRGLIVRDVLRQQLQQALRHFVNASLCQSDQRRCATESEASLQIGLTLMDELSGDVVAFGGSHGAVSTVPGLWGVSLHDPAEIPYLPLVSGAPWNSCLVRPTWRHCEPNPGEWNWQEFQQMLDAARRTRSRLACGPLLRLSRDELPDWLYLWGDDFDTIQSYVTAFVQAIATQFRQDVALWYCSAGTNAEDAFQMSEEQRLRLTVSALESLRQADPRTPAIVSIRQPWGEYLGRTSMDLSPRQFADILVRAELGLSGIGLELSIDCRLGKTLTRSLLEFHRLIDRWSVFGLPLVLFLSIPTPTERSESGDSVLDYVAELLRMLSHRSSVNGIVWNPLCDEADWSGGLLGMDGQAKPLLKVLQQFRE